MGLTISIRPQTAHLLVCVSGIFNLKKSTENMDQIFDACNKYKMSRVLVDFREVKGCPSVMDNFDHVVFTAQKQIQNISTGGQHIRFAYLGSDPFLFNDTFSESVAANRGLDLKITTKIQEAARFLGIEDDGFPEFE